MGQALFCGLAAFAVGAGIGLINYLISKKILVTMPDRFAISAVFRQVLNVGYLVICYVVGEKTELNLLALLIGAVLGITLTTFYFTYLLLRVNQTSGTTNKGDIPEKGTREEDDHG